VHCLPAWASTSVGRLIAGSERAGTVIAASPMASYVAIPDGDDPDALLALVAPQAVRLPIGVCVSAGTLPLRDCEVLLGGGVVATRDQEWRPVRWWDPRPHLDSAALVAGADVLIDVVRAEPASSFGLPLEEALAVAAALAHADAGAADRVLGLGAGLTPAGDDVVAGAFAVLAVAGRLDDSVRAAVETRARTRTTPLSAALVAAAGRGEMIPHAARLLASVASGASRRQVAGAARALFAVGSTSGHDLAAGLAGALNEAGCRRSRLRSWVAGGEVDV
jgi:Protein of unknown function (DUF2877)